MRNRGAQFVCLLGVSLVSSGCYNNPEINARQPGAGDEHIHGKPQVGPGTTAGGSTAGPQPAAREHGKSEVAPAAGTLPTGHSSEAKPAEQPGAGTPANVHTSPADPKSTGSAAHAPAATH